MTKETEKTSEREVLCPVCNGTPHPDRSCYCGSDGVVPLWAYDKFKQREKQKDALK